MTEREGKRIKETRKEMQINWNVKNNYLRLNEIVKYEGYKSNHEITFRCWIETKSLQYYIYFRWLFHGWTSSCWTLSDWLKMKNTFLILEQFDWMNFRTDRVYSLLSKRFFVSKKSCEIRRKETPKTRINMEHDKMCWNGSGITYAHQIIN